MNNNEKSGPPAYLTELPREVEKIVTALCLDYKRRAEALSAHTVSHRTEVEYRYLNFKIAEAAEEVIGERFAMQYIYEIGHSIGYAKSRITCYSETSYKNYKQLIRKNIAKKLHLCD